MGQDLCEVCNRLDVAPWTVGYVQDPSSAGRYYWYLKADLLCFQHHQDITEVRKAASQCRLCKIIVKAFERIHLIPDTLADGLPIALHRTESGGIGVSFDSPREGLTNFCELDLTAKYRLTDDPPIYGDEFISILRRMNPDSGSSSATSLARRWLSLCAAEHNCAAPASPPSRLLNVGTKTRVPFLEDFPPGTPVMKWVALSYCWGSTVSQAPFQKLTRNTVNLLKKGVALRDFDATVRDAILVTRGLGISHLWIDALCIFQDGLSGDWAEEFTKMSAIYGNSTVTLIPVDSDSVTQGFLGPREIQDVAINRLTDCRVSEGDSVSTDQIYLCQSWNPTHDELEGPWSTRAWTFQESLLPNCLLYYSSSQMVWKCRDSIIYERGISHKPLEEVIQAFVDEGGADYESFKLFNKFKLLEWVIQGPACHIDRQKYDLWYEIVKEYTLRHIRDREDRLLALSGLAAKYGEIIGDDGYCAGLWKTDLVRGLLWRVRDCQFHAYADQRLEGYGGFPSWSWARMEPGLKIINKHMNIEDVRPVAEILSPPQCSLDSSRLQPAVKNNMTIRGPTFEFPRLYYTQQQADSMKISAFERHLSKTIDHEQSKHIQILSQEAHYAAVIVLKEICVSVLGILILKRLEDQTSSDAATFERVGSVRIEYLSECERATPSLLSKRGSAANRLAYQLNPPKPRRVFHEYSNEIIDEQRTKPWPHRSVEIV